MTEFEKYFKKLESSKDFFIYMEKIEKDAKMIFDNVKTTKNVINSRNKDYKIEIPEDYPNCINIDFPIGSLAMKIITNCGGIKISLFVHKKEKKKYLEDLKNIIGENFPFDQYNENEYILEPEDAFNFIKIPEATDIVFDGIEKLKEQYASETNT